MKGVNNQDEQQVYKGIDCWRYYWCFRCNDESRHDEEQNQEENDAGWKKLYEKVR